MAASNASGPNRRRERGGCCQKHEEGTAIKMCLVLESTCINGNGQRSHFIDIFNELICDEAEESVRNWNESVLTSIICDEAKGSLRNRKQSEQLLFARRRARQGIMQNIVDLLQIVIAAVAEFQLLGFKSLSGRFNIF